MDLLTETLLITLVAAIGFAHDGLGSFMYNRPIIMGPLVGLVLGDLRLGIMTGATLELVWLGAFPVGASCPPEMVSGSIIGTSFVIKTGGDPGAAIALAVPVATLVLMIKSGLRVVITSPVFCAHADKCAAAGDAKGVENTERIGWAFEIISLSLIVGISYYLGVPQIEAIIKAIPEFVNHGLNVATGIIPAIGPINEARTALIELSSKSLLFAFSSSIAAKIPYSNVDKCGVIAIKSTCLCKARARFSLSSSYNLPTTLDIV